VRALTPTGAPDKSVTITEVPPPDPRPNELVIAVEAISVNRGETFLLADPKPGWRPGKDIAGTVVTAAAGRHGCGERPASSQHKECSVFYHPSPDRSWINRPRGHDTLRGLQERPK
jgi:NADPH:quinone reductase-like Zn-dependent oxidoreductase